MSAPLLTPAQAAERLAVSASWLTRKAGRGEIPHVKVGRWVRFRSEDLDAIVAAGQRLPDAAPDVIPMRRSTPTPPPAASAVPVLRARPEAARRTPRTSA